MAKNLKINIKNAQLAEALNLGDLKKIKTSPPPKKEAPATKKEPASSVEAPAAVNTEEEPRRIKARSRYSPPTPKVEPAEQELIKEEVENEPLAEEVKTKENLQASPAIEDTKAPEPPAQPPITPEISEMKMPKSKEAPPPAPVLTAPSTPTPAPKQDRPLPPKFPFQRPAVAGKPYVKLGPTGRHVNDLFKPKPRPPATPAERPRSGDPAKKPAAAGPLKESATKRPGETTSTDTGFKRPAKPKEFRDIKPLRKQEGMRSFDARDRQGLRAGEDENWRKKRAYKQKMQAQEDLTIRPTSLKVRLPISVKDLAEKMKLKASQLIAKLFMQGLVITLNDLLNDETTVQLLGHEFGCEITIDTSEEERIRITDKNVAAEIASSEADKLVKRPPVIAFMGHVDHGKTSLIDAIRKSNRVASEAGAITQHIGAFRCHTSVGDLTILDTPGHEAFAAMRSRGAKVTDIVVLVIAGDEGMRQQTIEALQQAKEAAVAIVVAINKADKQGFNVENVYKQLSEHELLPEAWGGTTITVNCSAVSGQGVSELLEMLALQSDILELKADPTTRARGTVLESEMHKGLGSVATVLVQNGTLHLGDCIVFDNEFGKIKTMRDESGKNILQAGPSAPVQITGLSGLPEAGHEFIVVKNEREAREIAEARREGLKQQALQQTKRFSLEKLSQKTEEQPQKVLHVILKADVQGSVEALKASLMRIHSKKVVINVVYSGVGEVSESDVQLAAASGAVIIGFHTQIESHAELLIKQSKIGIYTFDIIYHAIEGVKDLMKGLLDKIEEEKDTGKAEVKVTFKASHLGVIAGCIVTEGVIHRNNRIRCVRNGKVVWKGGISSLKRVKEDVREVKKGLECGILLQNYHEVQENDELQAYEVIYLSQEL